MCIALNQLPGSGGLLDQDPLWVRRIQLVAEAQAEAEKMRARRHSGS